MSDFLVVRKYKSRALSLLDTCYINEAVQKYYGMLLIKPILRTVRVKNKNTACIFSQEFSSFFYSYVFNNFVNKKQLTFSYVLCASAHLTCYYFVD